MKRWTNFLLCWYMYIAFTAGQECYDNWHYHEGSCYGFGETATSWGEAQEICEAFGGTLAEIGNSEENEWLKNMCRSRGGDHYWLGGSDIFHEGSWVWTSTRSQIYPFKDWAPGEPTNSGVHEDCLTLYEPVNYRWNDAPCEGQYTFICETKPQEPVIGYGEIQGDHPI